MMGQAQSKNNRSGKPRILIVDDDPDITYSFKIGLEQHGFDVETFNNPILAISDYVSGSYDLLLLDIRMPLMDGFELYKEIRKKDEKVKVCFITAYEISEDGFKRSFPEMVLKHFIKKPISIPDLANEIDSKLNEDFEIIG
jgi:two-component system, OmpR family, response regulator ChvI